MAQQERLPPPADNPIQTAFKRVKGNNPDAVQSVEGINRLPLKRLEKIPDEYLGAAIDYLKTCDHPHTKKLGENFDRAWKRGDVKTYYAYDAQVGRESLLRILELIDIDGTVDRSYIKADEPNIIIASNNVGHIVIPPHFKPYPLSRTNNRCEFVFFSYRFQSLPK